MVGWNVTRNPNGIRIYAQDTDEPVHGAHKLTVALWLDEETCLRIYEEIKHAKRVYWKKLKKRKK